MRIKKTQSLNLSDYMPYQLVNLAKRVSDACNADYGAPHGISVAEWRLLARLGEHRELNSLGLGDTTFMDKSRVSRAVKRLESKGYLIRRVDSLDNRASYLSLTESGWALYTKIVPSAVDWEAEFLSVLDKAEYSSLLRTLKKLELKLDQLEGGAQH